MAAVLLRRIFLQLEYKDLEQEVDNDVLRGCRVELLLAIQAEEHNSIRKKICDAAAELARSSIGVCVCACVWVCACVCVHVLCVYFILYTCEL